MWHISPRHVEADTYRFAYDNNPATDVCCHHLGWALPLQAGCHGSATSACLLRLWRQGPLQMMATDRHVSLPPEAMEAGPTPGDGDKRWSGCRHGPRRQVPASIGRGGMCHVSPGRPYRYWEVVFFSKYFDRWSFLTIH
jgi:hypothetical protein